ncbi:hypothetical protein [Micromonospora sp. NPDC050276]|uniref:hypothetical protein n=1 Tax=Micromonospora sp. NPDC050276 TaxID=3364278 RepID=UPI0037B37CD5
MSLIADNDEAALRKKATGGPCRGDAIPNPSASKYQMEAMAELIKIDEQERKERPDLGTRGHDTTPFPQPKVGQNAWSDPINWAPRPSKPAA